MTLNVVMNTILLLTLVCRIVHGYSFDNPEQMVTLQPTPRHDHLKSLDDGVESNTLGPGVLRGLVDTWNACHDDEENGVSNSTLACHGVKMIRNVVAQLLDSQKAFQISNGVEIVAIPEDPRGRSSRKLEDNDKGLVSHLRRFLQSREIRIRLQELLPLPEDLNNYWNDILQRFNGGSQEAGRKKDKGGGGGAMIVMGMGLMSFLAMGVMAAMGVAMKGVAMGGVGLALALAALIKKLASKDDGGGHHVSVVPVHGGGDHHRRRRSGGELPYQGWYHNNEEQPSSERLVK